MGCQGQERKKERERETPMHMRWESRERWQSCVFPLCESIFALHAWFVPGPRIPDRDLLKMQSVETALKNRTMHGSPLPHGFGLSSWIAWMQRGASAAKDWSKEHHESLSHNDLTLRIKQLDFAAKVNSPMVVWLWSTTWQGKDLQWLQMDGCIQQRWAPMALHRDLAPWPWS